MYLGLDLSTQQLKAVIVDDNFRIRTEASIHFDNDLPEFRTSGGVVKNQTNPKVITAPTLMWVKALDVLLAKLQSNGTDFNKILAVSGCAQQHGTVYWAKNSQAKLQNLQSSKVLHEELQNCFALSDSPTWMDSSTKKECDMLENAVGGARRMAEITGSRAYERFSAAQIAKVARERSDVYLKTERISLVSSFLASLLIGDYAPIDWSDGSGMNLLDIHRKLWSDDLLQACAPKLEDKLGDPVPSHTDIGLVSKYFVEKYGFNSKCRVIAFTGDNPSSLAGMRLRKGDVACSLGTSDTLFLWLDETKVVENGHVLCNPLDEQSYMALLWNGSLTRERIRNEFANNSWNLFDELLNSTPCGNFGNLALYLDTQEVLPPLTGDYRFNGKNEQVDEFDSNAVDVRALTEGQFIVRRIFAEDFGFSIDSDTRIVATGGASTNKNILQVLADVFNSPVYTTETTNAAVLGAAYRAKIGFLKNNVGAISEELFESSSELILACRPQENADVYNPLVLRFRSIIQKLVKKHKISICE